MKARTISGRSPQEIKLALEETFSDGFSPVLAMVFISIKQDHEAVCSLLTDKGIQIMGCTSSGEFINSNITEGGIAIMLFDMDPSHFKLLFLETMENSSYETSRQLGIEGRSMFNNAAFIIVSGWLHKDGELIIKGLEDGYGDDVIVFGGMAGDDITLEEPKVFTRNKISSTGMMALILDRDRIEVNGLATCGWKPVGITKTITKSDGNVIYTIDEQPAFDLVLKYLGLNVADMKGVTNTVVNLGAYYPLQLERPDAPPVMRTAMLGNLEDRSLICAGNVPQGAKVRFSLPPDFDVIDTVVEECRNIVEGADMQADAVIMFSCISRYLSFGTLTVEELERVRNIWKAPFAGFFSYGEFGRSSRGKHEFHNNTCCVVTLKEK